jgi:FkbM family methyltransferase
MYMRASTLIRACLRKFGYDICWSDERRDPFEDMKRMTRASPVIFDIGANLGQTIADFQGTFNNPTIHAFEPGRVAFMALNETYSTNQNIFLNNIALGDRSQTRIFMEHKRHNMSSFLESGPDIQDTTSERFPVEISTVDDYCDSHGIEKIDILKSDTQGFELEVLKGAQRTIQRGGIELVLLEINFAELYKDIPPIDEILRFFRLHHFSLVAFYRFYYCDNRVVWTDALFQYKGEQ